MIETFVPLLRDVIPLPSRKGWLIPKIRDGFRRAISGMASAMSIRSPFWATSTLSGKS